MESKVRTFRYAYFSSIPYKNVFILKLITLKLARNNISVNPMKKINVSVII